MKGKRLISILVIVSLLLAVGATPVCASDGDLREVPPSKMGKAKFVPDEILVKFRGDMKPFRVIKVPEGKVGEKVKEYLKRTDIEYAEPNYYAYASWSPNDGYYSYQWHMDDDNTNNPGGATSNPYGGDNGGGIRMEEAWEISTGEGVTVAIIDTGVAYEDYEESRWRKYEQASDLADTCFVAGYDFVNNDSHPNDDYSPGHGTHVAGTVAQSTNNGIGAAGIAFNACLMPVKVLNSMGVGTYGDIADGIYFAVDNGAQVINLSLGGSLASTTLEEAVAYAYNNGVTVIAAAGNEGENVLIYPAAYDDYVIAVGATRYDETLAYYSNFGSSLDLVAPGGDLNVDQNGDGYGDGVLQQTYEKRGLSSYSWGYYFWSGTSMATPHVSGVAALLIANGNVTTPDEIRAALQETAEDLGDSGRDDTYGWGLVDAYAALQWTAVPNNPPEANDDSASTPEDTAVIIDVLANDTDADGDTLTVTNLTQPTSGTATVNADQTVTYAPNPDFNDIDSFTYTANDGKIDSNVATVTITVEAVNDAPVANDDSATTSEDTAVTIDVLANDTDAEGDTLTVTNLTQPTSGTATVNTDQTVTYEPKANFNGTDSFTYTANDGEVDSNVATVTVTVEEVNNPPKANNDSASTPEDTAVIIDILANDTDADGDTLTVTNLTQPTSGTATVNADQTVTYEPNPDFNGTDSFTYTANDGKVDSNVATVTVTVEAVNDAPVAVNDAYSMDENTTLTVAVPGVLANDSDVEGDELTAVLVEDVSNGTLALSANGSFHYTPDSGFVGDDTFTYTANDGEVDSNVATVTVTVNPAAPTAWVNIELSKQAVWRWWRVTATVTITETDDSGSAISNATVEAHWSGAYSNTVSDTTDKDGKVSFRTSFIRGSGTVTFTVDKVVKDGQEYILDGERSKSVSNSNQARSRRE